MQDIIQEKKPATTRRKRTEILQLLKEYKQGKHKSIPAFCKSRNITPANFYSWRKRYTAMPPLEVKGFTSLPFSSEPSEVHTVAPSLFAEVGDIKLYQAVPAAYLKSLLP